MKEISRNLIAKVSLRSILIIFGLGILGLLLFFRLTTMLPGWSMAELATRYNDQSLHYILYHPINAPYSLLVFLLVKMMPHSILSVRLASIFFGVATIILFFFIVRRWFGGVVASLTSLMLASSTWFLRSARQGTPDVLLFGLLLFVSLNLWLRLGHHRRLAIGLIGLSLVLSLYIPGLIWFIVAACIWQRRLILALVQKLHLKPKIIIISGAVILFLPLLWAIIHNYRLVWSVLGLPTRVPAAWPTIRHLADVGLNLFAHGPYQPGLWVGRSPVLDVVEIVLFIFGVYTYWHKRQFTRLYSLAVIFIITTILVALDGPISLSLIIPFVFLAIAAGLSYLIKEWLSTFPRNPIARGVGMSLVVLAILLSCFFQLNRYFIAWPHMSQVKSTFSYRLKS